MTLKSPISTGQAITVIREALGVSVRQLCDLLDWDTNAVPDIETPSGDTSPEHLRMVLYGIVMATGPAAELPWKMTAEAAPAIDAGARVDGRSVHTATEHPWRQGFESASFIDPSMSLVDLRMELRSARNLVVALDVRAAARDKAAGEPHRDARANALADSRAAEATTEPITRCDECQYFDQGGYLYQNLRCAAGSSVVGLDVEPLVDMVASDGREGGELPCDDIWKHCPMAGRALTMTWPGKMETAPEPLSPETHKCGQARQDIDALTRHVNAIERRTRSKE